MRRKANPLKGGSGPRALRNALLAVPAVAAGLLLAWLALPPERQEAASEGLSSMEGEKALEPRAPRQAAVQSPAPHPGAEPPPVRAVPLWGAADPSAVPNPPPYPDSWSTEGRALVRLSSDLVAAGGLGVGDRITLAVPQLGKSRAAAVEAVKDGPGARSLLGWTEWDRGRPQRWVVTVAPTSLFAWIDTPEGPHELSVRHGAREGWLVPTASRMAGFDYSSPDTFVIDEVGRHTAPRAHGPEARGPP